MARSAEPPMSSSLLNAVATGTPLPEHRPGKSAAIRTQSVAPTGKFVKWCVLLTRTEVA